MWPCTKSRPSAQTASIGDAVGVVPGDVGVVSLKRKNPLGVARTHELVATYVVCVCDVCVVYEHTLY